MRTQHEVIIIMILSLSLCSVGVLIFAMLPQTFPVGLFMLGSGLIVLFIGLSIEYSRSRPKSQKRPQKQSKRASSRRTPVLVQDDMVTKRWMPKRNPKMGIRPGHSDSQRK